MKAHETFGRVHEVDTVTSEQEQFIVQVRYGTFFAMLREGIVMETPHPSAAVHMRYALADAVCQRLLKRGHRESVVCDIYGTPVNAFDLERQHAPLADEIREVWNDELTGIDQQIFHAVCSGEDPAAIAKRLSLPESDLRKHLENAIRRYGDIAQMIHDSNQDKRALREQIETKIRGKSQ